MKTTIIAAVLLAVGVVAHAAGTGVAYGRVTTIQLASPTECVMEIESAPLSGDLTRIYYRGRLKKVCETILPFDIVLAPFSLEPALCGPDICSNIVGTSAPSVPF